MSSFNLFQNELQTCVLYWKEAPRRLRRLCRRLQPEVCHDFVGKTFFVYHLTHGEVSYEVWQDALRG